MYLILVFATLAIFEVNGEFCTDQYISNYIEHQKQFPYLREHLNQFRDTDRNKAQEQAKQECQELEQQMNGD